MLREGQEATLKFSDLAFELPGRRISKFKKGLGITGERGLQRAAQEESLHGKEEVEKRR